MGGPGTERGGPDPVAGGPGPDRDSLDRGRVFALSDGVFAIAATLLALDLRIPEGLAHDALVEALRALGPDLRGFVISFLVIGLLWLSHHRIFLRFRRITGRVAGLNVLLLGLVALLPFPSSLVSDYDDPIAVTIYAADVGLVAVLQMLILTSGWRERDLLPGQPESLPLLLAPSAATALVFGASIPIALVSAEAAMYSWLLLLPIQILLDRRLTARTPRAGVVSPLR